MESMNSPSSKNNQCPDDQLSKSDWKSALMSQDACNIVALTSELARVTKVLIRAGLSSDSINNHAVVRLYVTQIAWLSFGSIMDTEKYTRAYEEAKGMLDE